MAPYHLFISKARGKKDFLFRRPQNRFWVTDQASLGGPPTLEDEEYSKTQDYECEFDLIVVGLEIQFV